MSQSTISTPPTPAPVRAKGGRRRFVIEADWRFYTQMLRVFEAKPGHRLTYDRGRLEIMSPSLRHDRADRFLASLIPLLAEGFGLPMVPGGGVTLRQKKKRKGIEGDDVFWLANAPQVFTAAHLDLAIHPPPDLAIEVDVSRSSFDRLSIYAAMGVPEVWRLDGDDLIFHVLVPGSKFAPSAVSLSFPTVAPGDLLGFLQMARTGDHIAVLVEFREWVRQRAGK